MSRSDVIYETNDNFPLVPMIPVVPYDALETIRQELEAFNFTDNIHGLEGTLLNDLRNLFYSVQTSAYPDYQRWKPTLKVAMAEEHNITWAQIGLSFYSFDDVNLKEVDGASYADYIGVAPREIRTYFTSYKVSSAQENKFMAFVWREVMPVLRFLCIKYYNPPKKVTGSPVMRRNLQGDFEAVELLKAQRCLAFNFHRDLTARNPLACRDWHRYPLPFQHTPAPITHYVDLAEHFRNQTN